MEGANCPKPALLIFSWHVRTTTSLYSKLSHVHKQSEGAPLIRNVVQLSKFGLQYPNQIAILVE